VANATREAVDELAHIDARPTRDPRAATTVSDVTTRLPRRLGPLAERPFRLLFGATTVSTFGDAIGHIALAFAVLALPDAGPSELGLVLAARSLVNALVVVAGGVVSDRLPRNVVLVGASLLQGTAQALTAGLILTGTASVWSLVLLAAVYGAGWGLVVPAEVGLVPQTVSASRLQQANALQGLSRSTLGIIGPALGGIFIVAGSPGTALAIDAATFFVAAALFAGIRVHIGAHEQKEGFLRELVEGWREFTKHSWLWSTVLLFGVSNFVWVGSWAVLGPVIAKEELGGAGAWATVLSTWGVGAVVGGVVALRYKPKRPLFASVLVAWPLLIQLLCLALLAPVWVLSIASFFTGAGIALHLALWFTVFQREIPEHAQSRVSSYDALGSFVLIPLGMAAAGPVSDLIGVQATIWASFAISLACQIAIVLVPSVRSIRAPEPEQPPADAPTETTMATR
jgi:MFS family permease